MAALGAKWKMSNDQFTFTTVQTNVPLTKRGILSVVSSVFDPLGLLSPFVLRAKAILQELWRLKYGWHEIINESLHKSWQIWINELPSLPSISIARCYGNSDDLETTKNCISSVMHQK